MAIRYGPFGLLARIEFGLLSIVLLLICLYFWQAREYGKSKMGWWVWVTVVSIAWTLIGCGIGALRYGVSYVGLLTFRPEAWEGLGWMGPLGMGPFGVVIGLVGMMRRAILKSVGG
jgi:hypothetical protein